MSKISISNKKEKCIDKVVIESKKRVEKEEQIYNAKYVDIFKVFY